MIFEAPETTEIQFYGAIFYWRLNYYLYCLWIDASAISYLSWSDHITSNSVRFWFRREKKMLGKFSQTIPFHLIIIDIALCALCDFRYMLRLKFDQKEYSNRRGAHWMIKYNISVHKYQIKWKEKKTGLIKYWNVASYAIQIHVWDSKSAHDAFILYFPLWLLMGAYAIPGDLGFIFSPLCCTTTVTSCDRTPNTEHWTPKSLTLIEMLKSNVIKIIIDMLKSSFTLQSQCTFHFAIT